MIMLWRMTIVNLLEKSNSYCEELHDQLHGVELPDDARSSNAAACLHIALEHQRAVLQLYSGTCPISAGAILRSQVEAYVKGAWLRNCATDAQVNRFMKDRDPKPFTSMVAALEESDKGYSAELAEVLILAWRSLSNYIHSSAAQVSSRISDSEIVGRYITAEVVDGIRLSSAIGFLVGIEFAKIAKNQSLEYRLYKLYESAGVKGF